MSPPPRAFAIATTLVTSLIASSALANGLSTHTWVSLRARELVDEPALRELVNDPALRDMLLSGTIFPDGGYAVGDGYGEDAHWEPFQARFLEHIKSTHARPWSEDARQHIAFLLGMASHGMSDQIYDSLFMERSRVYDADSDWSKSFDEATDVIWCSIVGAQPVPPRWLPTDTLIALYQAQGRTVEKRILERGQNLAGLAVALVGMLSTDPVAIERYTKQYPWATANMEAANGRPESDAQVVARYWSRVWARLHDGQAAGDVVMATFPESGSVGHPTAADAVEARITLVFAHRLLTADVSAGRFELVDVAGAAHPFGVRLFYRNNSHVVHIIPDEDLAEDTEYTLRVKPGLPTAVAGPIAQGFEMTVDTTPPPPPSPEAPPMMSDDGGCRCLGAPRTVWWGLALAPIVALRRRSRR